jgi:putative membrane protein
MMTESRFYAHPLIVGLIHWVVSAIALKVTASLTKGFEVGGFFSALVAAFVIGAANFFIRPVLVFLTLPFTIITLGAFLFVVDAIILRMCAAVLPGFEVKSWLAAVFGAFILAVVGSGLHFLII